MPHKAIIKINSHANAASRNFVTVHFKSRRIFWKQTTVIRHPNSTVIFKGRLQHKSWVNFMLWWRSWMWNDRYTYIHLPLSQPETSITDDTTYLPHILGHDKISHLCNIIWYRRDIRRGDYQGQLHITIIYSSRFEDEETEAKFECGTAGESPYCQMSAAIRFSLHLSHCFCVCPFTTFIANVSS